MKINCPHCGRSGSVPDGQPLPAKARCPGCKQVFAPALAEPGKQVVPRLPGHPAPAVRAESPLPPAVVEPRFVHATSPPVERACDFCGESILPVAKKCRHCGEILDPVMRAADEAKRLAARPTATATPAPVHAPAAAPVIPIVIQNTVISSATAVAANTRRSSYGCGCLLAMILGFIMFTMIVASTGDRKRPAAVVAPRPPDAVAAPEPLPGQNQPQTEAGIAVESDVAPEAPTAPAAPAGPNARTLLNIGKGLEGRNAGAAIRYYEDVVRKFPDSAEASEATARIDALKKKGE